MAAHAGPGLATTAEIAELAAAAHVRGRLGIDTEFMSEGRYRALLCLVQVVVDGDDGDEPQIIVIDALDGARRRRRSPRVLADPAIEIVLHAGRQDVAILRRVWQTELNNIFDTQIAAGFAGGERADRLRATCSARSSGAASARPPATRAGTRAR